MLRTKTTPTHIAAGHRLPTASDARKIATICRRHDARLVVNRITGTDKIDWRVSNNAWWINAADLGHPFTAATLTAIREDLAAAGIELE